MGIALLVFHAETIIKGSSLSRLKFRNKSAFFQDNLDCSVRILHKIP